MSLQGIMVDLRAGGLSTIEIRGLCVSQGGALV